MPSSQALALCGSLAREHLHDGSSLPAEVNWITAVAVNPVKDQGHADLAGRFPPLAALRELGSSLLLEVAVLSVVVLGSSLLLEVRGSDQPAAGLDSVDKEPTLPAFAKAAKRTQKCS